MCAKDCHTVPCPSAPHHLLPAPKEMVSRSEEMRVSVPMLSHPLPFSS
jgi:hypothetical protein